MAKRHKGRRGSRHPVQSCRDVAKRLHRGQGQAAGIVRIVEYRDGEGNIPFRRWLGSLRDAVAVRRIVIRIKRMELGSRGDWKSVGCGVFELRMDFGPGYRVYFAQDGPTVVLLLGGGDKSSQSRDIGEAHACWKDYKDNDA